MRAFLELGVGSSVGLKQTLSLFVREADGLRIAQHFSWVSSDVYLGVRETDDWRRSGSVVGFTDSGLFFP
jgi:hypothetical protein